KYPSAPLPAMASPQRIRDDGREAWLLSLVPYLLALHSKRRRIPRSREHLHRGSIYRFRVSPHQYPVVHGVQRAALGLRSLPDPRRSSRRSLWTAPRADDGRYLVGRIHCDDCSSSGQHQPRPHSFYRNSFSARRRRSCGLSRLQSVCRSLDSLPRARYRQRMDICRRGRRRRPFASADHLPDASLWLAHILLGMCSARADRWRRLVSHRAGFSRRAPKCFPRRTGIHPLRSDGKNFARRSSKAGPLEKRAYQQRSACRDVELFLLWICRLDFLQLVLYLFGSSARFEPEGQRLLRHASISRNGGLLTSRRSAQRPPYSNPL